MSSGVGVVRYAIINTLTIMPMIINNRPASIGLLLKSFFERVLCAPGK